MIIKLFFYLIHLKLLLYFILNCLASIVFKYLYIEYAKYKTCPVMAKIIIMSLAWNERSKRCRIVLIWIFLKVFVGKHSSYHLLITYRCAGFHMPTPISQDIIMIGAGSGLAPFRSFWQHRAELTANNLGRCSIIVASFSIYQLHKRPSYQAGCIHLFIYCHIWFMLVKKGTYTKRCFFRIIFWFETLLVLVLGQ